MTDQSANDRGLRERRKTIALIIMYEASTRALTQLMIVLYSMHHEARIGELGRIMKAEHSMCRRMHAAPICLILENIINKS